jgi:hypothetical protein
MVSMKKELHAGFAAGPLVLRAVTSYSRDQEK